MALLLILTLAACTATPAQKTSRIPNALIGLETGVIPDEHYVWRWDGSPRALRSWEQDLDLAGALRVSCVPCFQDVARRIGSERMRRYLRDFGYGNQDVSAPIDQFWLTGNLRITPREQVALIHRMLAGELPVKMANVELLWRMLENRAWTGLLSSGQDRSRLTRRTRHRLARRVRGTRRPPLGLRDVRPEPRGGQSRDRDPSTDPAAE